jgi:hypothetical protein
MQQPHRITSQLGKGSAGCFFSILLLASMAYLGYKFFPPIFSNYQLQDEVNDLATYGLMRTGSKGQETIASDVQKAILNKAEELGIPLKKEDVKVKTGSNNIEITVNYSIPITLPGYTYNYEPEIKSKR